MIRRTYLYVISILAATGLVIWLLWPKAPQPLRASLIAEAAPLDASGFTRVHEPAAGRSALIFPADHGPHPDYQTEWWYFTGNLTTAAGEHFGYQLTFFRRGLVAPDQRVPRTSAWATDQIYMAHFALTDVAGRDHYAFEKLARGAVGLAGAQAEPFRVWLKDWSVSALSFLSSSTSLDPLSLRASSTGTSLDLTLRARKAPILHGERGYSRKGPEPGNASYYYSLTRIATQGTVNVDGQAFTVDGWSWMDHEFSTSALGSAQVGWDWFSMQFDDGSELMIFQLRRSDGSVDAFSSGTFIAADGTTRSLGAGDFSIQVTDRWRSPRTGGDYPAGWVLTAPDSGLRLVIEPWLADQEMALSYVYWEGAVRVTGTAGGPAVSGNGYVELTGYAGSIQGQF